jgi:hypothetical protein
MGKSLISCEIDVKKNRPPALQRQGAGKGRAGSGRLRDAATLRSS